MVTIKVETNDGKAISLIVSKEMAEKVLYTVVPYKFSTGNKSRQEIERFVEDNLK
jgi:hypothetical protein